jgi:hypothetical protein
MARYSYLACRRIANGQPLVSDRRLPVESDSVAFSEVPVP